MSVRCDVPRPQVDMGADQVMMQDIAEQDAAKVGALPWGRTDVGILLAVMAFTLAFGMTHVRWHIQPFEDSLMLLRYADHLAHGAGIVWNIGDKPVEGATDFLFLVCVSGVMKLTGMHPILACRALLLVCQVAGAGFLYYGTRRLFGAGRVLAASLALFYAVGPGVLHITGGFSPPFYGLMAMVAWFFACKAVVDGPTDATSFGFALVALLTALTRPDGLVLAVLMGVAILYALRGRSVRMLTIAFGVFLVLGGAYFLWRYHYFGYLLPNPFYKKGGGHLYPESMKFSITNVLKMILPVTPVVWFAAAKKSLRQRAVFLLIPVVGFACVWILLTTENNWNMRFQYVLLPITLMTIPYLAGGLKKAEAAMSWSRTMSVATVAAALLASLMYWRVTFPPAAADGSSMHDIAVSLAQFKDKGYTMAITEAGTLPYFSAWRAIDTWGLNDPHMMHDPHGLTDAYLDESRPAIIMYHVGLESPAEFRHVWLGDGGPVAGPQKFNGPLSHYAVTHDYELVARWGPSPCNLHVWYVRRDIPDFEAIKRIIQGQPHFFLDGGPIATNYMQTEPPMVCGDPGEHLGWRD